MYHNNTLLILATDSLLLPTTFHQITKSVCLNENWVKFNWKAKR